MKNALKLLRDKGFDNQKIATICGISRQAVAKWTRVPVKHVFAIEKKTGISRRTLRPDVYP